MPILPDSDLLKITTVKDKDQFTRKFVLEPLSPGYGLTIGHALRRVLLSSLTGAAINSVEIDGVSHEFSTIAGVKEDVIEMILNLKQIRFKLHGDEPTAIKLEKKGPGVVKAGDFAKNSLVEVINPEMQIATLDKNGKLVLKANIKKGRGYEPVERRKDEKIPLGTIAIDSIYTPVKKIHYAVENTRVGGMTNYDKVTFEITTDGTITPEEAFNTANQILIEHFNLISDRFNVKKESKKNQSEVTEKEEKKTAKSTKTTVSKKKESSIAKNKKAKK
jgi:DNA-directed RNA polymerase subunit alpha